MGIKEWNLAGSFRFRKNLNHNSYKGCFFGIKKIVFQRLKGLFVFNLKLLNFKPRFMLS